jgi:hypothetical protein
VTGIPTATKFLSLYLDWKKLKIRYSKIELISYIHIKIGNFVERSEIIALENGFLLIE